MNAPHNYEAAASWAQSIRNRAHLNGIRAVAARGVHPQFDAQTAAVLPDFILEAHPRERRGLTRAVGILLSNHRLPSSQLSLGASLTKVAASGTAKRVSLLPDLGTDDAARILNDLLSRGAGVNAYALTRALAYWDTGHRTTDREMRTGIVYDFYTALKG